MARPFFAYIFLCVDKSYYVGHTDDLGHRPAQHHEGEIPGYTATRRPVTLVWSQQFPTREEALAAERRIKKLEQGQEGSANWRGLLEPKASAKKKDWAGYRKRKQH